VDRHLISGRLGRFEGGEIDVAALAAAPERVAAVRHERQVVLTLGSIRLWGKQGRERITFSCGIFAVKKYASSASLAGILAPLGVEAPRWA
jgi:hypothetical protein